MTSLKSTLYVLLLQAGYRVIQHELSVEKREIRL